MSFLAILAHSARCAHFLRPLRTTIPSLTKPYSSTPTAQAPSPPSSQNPTPTDPQKRQQPLYEQNNPNISLNDIKPFGTKQSSEFRQFRDGGTVTPWRVPSTEHPMFHSREKEKTWNKRIWAITGVWTVFMVWYCYNMPAAQMEAASSVDGVNLDVEEERTEEGSVSEFLQVDQVSRARKAPGVYVWGSNKNGLLTPGEEEEKGESFREARSIKFFEGQVLRDIAFSDSHAAAIDASGTLLQWSSTSTTAPTPTLPLQNLISLALTPTHVYALSKSGAVFAVPSPPQPRAVDYSDSWFSPSYWFAKVPEDMKKVQ
ncbi:hypothetical protein HK097_004889, partial [Rhizophlyctis rosea]